MHTYFRQNIFSALNLPLKQGMAACCLVAFVLTVIAPKVFNIVCSSHSTCSIYTCCFCWLYSRCFYFFCPFSHCFGWPFPRCFCRLSFRFPSCFCRLFLHCFCWPSPRLLAILSVIFSLFSSAVFSLILSAIFTLFLLALLFSSAALLFLSAILLTVLEGCSSHLFSIPAAYFFAPTVFLSYITSFF